LYLQRSQKVNYEITPVVHSQSNLMRSPSYG
jgi:hypothetical protein